MPIYAITPHKIGELDLGDACTLILSCDESGKLTNAGKKVVDTVDRSSVLVDKVLKAHSENVPHVIAEAVKLGRDVLMMAVGLGAGGKTPKWLVEILNEYPETKFIVIQVIEKIEELGMAIALSAPVSSAPVSSASSALDISVVKGDIRKTMDGFHKSSDGFGYIAMVNPTNPGCFHTGGIAAAIDGIAGSGYDRDDCGKPPKVPTSTARAFWSRKASLYVINATGPNGNTVKNPAEFFKLLKKTYQSALFAAKGAGADLVIFPAISGSIFAGQYSKEKIFETGMNTVKEVISCPMFAGIRVVFSAYNDAEALLWQKYL